MRFSLPGLRRRLATWRASKRRPNGTGPIRAIRCTRPQKKGALPLFVLRRRVSTAENPEHASPILLLWWVGCDCQYVQTPREVRWTSELCISSRHREAKRIFSLGTCLRAFKYLHIFRCELRHSLNLFGAICALRSVLCGCTWRASRQRLPGAESNCIPNSYSCTRPQEDCAFYGFHRLLPEVRRLTPREMFRL
jgi:hypothetical protein